LLSIARCQLPFIDHRCIRGILSLKAAQRDHFFNRNRFSLSPAERRLELMPNSSHKSDLVSLGRIAVFDAQSNPADVLPTVDSLATVPHKRRPRKLFDGSPAVTYPQDAEAHGGFVGSLGLNKLFDAHTEDARFDDWNKGRRPEFLLVYVCEYGTLWKFTAREWWLFATQASRNNGSYDLPMSRALRRCPKGIMKGEDGKFHSSDNTLRCVNPLDWTVGDWKRELS
jgi:hypothetical protein